MRCPECSSLFGDELRGKQHCNECNTPLVVIALPDQVPYLAPRTVHKSHIYKSEAEQKQESRKASTVKRIYIVGDITPDLSLRCNFCTLVISKMTAVRGNIIVGWKQTLVPSTVYPGEFDEKSIPQFKEVYACTRCMTHLNEVLPDKMVNPIKDAKNGVIRNVKDVTCDTIRADEHDTEPCTTFVDWSGRVWNARSRAYEDVNNVCLYCRRSESAHSVRQISSRVYAESFNV